MRAVGIKQLKARLSEYIRLVKGGETVLVTEREQIVAEIRPARRQAAGGGGLEDILDRLAEAGELERASESRRGWTWAPRGLGLPVGTASSLLEQIRGDR